MNLARNNEMDECAIDLDILREFVGDDADILKHFLGRFFDALRTGMLNMRSMILLEQWTEVSALVHTLKTSALAIGAVKFATLCGAIEKLAAVPLTCDSEIDPRKILIQELNRSFIDVENAVNDVLPLVAPRWSTNES